MVLLLVTLTFVALKHIVLYTKFYTSVPALGKVFKVEV